MRIGTWNLEGKWTPSHERVLVLLDCDVLLLTEIHASLNLEGYEQQVSVATVGDAMHWAGIWSRTPMLRHPDPHPASVSAEARGVTFVCSVLPWPLCGDREPWEGSTSTDRMRKAVEQVASGLGRRPSVWGGDWNQPLTGDMRGFSRASQAVIVDAVQELDMAVPTTSLPAQNSEQMSIDHIAVPRGWPVLGAGSVFVPRDLSDHDAYWVEVSDLA
jgi:hypothetical protein